MSSRKDQQHSFPAVPPFLSAGDHETRDYYTEEDTSRPHINQSPYLTPYLGLRARLSQIWINRWTVLLLLILARTLFALASLNQDLATAKKEALSACTSVESIGSAMASMPYYLSKGTNELAANGIEKAVNGLETMLMLSITAVEELVVFVINMMTQTYVCLITFAISGSLHAALDLIKDVEDFLNQNLGPIGDDISSVVGSFTNELNKFIGTLNSIPFVNDKIPTLDVSGDINKLKNLQLPSGLDSDLQKLNSSIPNFAEVNNFTQTALRFPFEEVKTLIGSKLGNYTFDRSVFPNPQREQLTFCTGNNGINDFFEELLKLAIKAKKIFIGIIIILAILACIPMGLREIRRWRTQQKRAKLVTKSSSDPMDVIYIASRPYTASFGLSMARRFKSTRRQHVVRWIVAYATTVPALFILSLAVAGLLSCLCQYIIVKAIQKEVPALENEVAAFAETIVDALKNASGKWAQDVNGVINTTQFEINDHVLGWVNTSTSAINDTLNVFVDKMTDGLNTTFGGTVLYDPITEVLNCLIGLKIAGIQKGLTWAQDHAHVSFPMLPNNVFSLGANSSITNDTSVDSFLAAPGSKSRDEISEIVNDVVRKLYSTIRHEAIIATGLLFVWILIVLIGCTRALVLCFGRDKTRAEGGQRYPVIPTTTTTEPYRARDIRPESSAPPYEFTPSESYSQKAQRTPRKSGVRFNFMNERKTNSIITEKSHDPFA